MARTSLIPAVSSPTEGSFNNYPVMTFPCPGDATQPGIQLGVKKIRAILPYLKEAQAFVDKHSAKEKAKAEEKKVGVLTDKLRASLKAMGMSDQEIEDELKKLGA